MLIQSRTIAELESWNHEIKSYEKQKRTKKPFGTLIPPPHIITDKERKSEECNFNPVLQTFKSNKQQQQNVKKQEAKRTQSLLNQMVQCIYIQKYTNKYQKPYDIINLYPPSKSNVQQRSLRKGKPPIRHNFNIVSNQPLSEYSFRNGDIKFAEQAQKRIANQQKRDYNILTNLYDKNNTQRRNEEFEKTKNLIEQKYLVTHQQRNPITGIFYDKQKQQQYQQQLQIQRKQHGKDFIKRFPPSYIHRERFFANPSIQIPNQVKQFELKIKNTKKRYELKYILEKQYAEKNKQYDQKQNLITKNKLHEGKVIQMQKKQFDIINLNPYDMDTQLKLYGKIPTTSTWEKIIKTKTPKSEPNLALVIKTGGFD